MFERWVVGPQHPSYVHVKSNHHLAYASIWKSKYKTSTLYNLLKVGHLQNIVESIYNLPASQIAKTQYMFCMENWKLRKKKVCNQILVMPMTIWFQAQVPTEGWFQVQFWLDSRWRERTYDLVGGEIWAHSWCCWKAPWWVGSLGGDFVIFWTYDAR